MTHNSPLLPIQRGIGQKLRIVEGLKRWRVLQKAIQYDTLPNMKKPKTFRLSEQAQNHLADVVKMTGTNETAIVEMALAFLANKTRDDIVNHISSDTLTRRKIEKISDPLPPKKKRKRR